MTKNTFIEWLKTRSAVIAALVATTATITTLTATTADVSGTLTTNTINEHTNNQGVTVEAVWHRDGTVYPYHIGQPDSVMGSSDLVNLGTAFELGVTGRLNLSNGSTYDGELSLHGDPGAEPNLYADGGAVYLVGNSGDINIRPATSLIVPPTAYASISGVTLDTGRIIGQWSPTATETSGRAVLSYGDGPAHWIASLPSTTSEEVLKTWALCPNALTNGITRIDAWGTTAGNTNTKAVRLRLGGLSGTAVGTCNFSSASDTTWRATWLITHTSTANRQAFTVSCNGAGTSAGTTTQAVGYSARTEADAQDLVLTVQNSTSNADLVVNAAVVTYLP